MNFDLETFHKFDFTDSRIIVHNIYAERFGKALEDFYFEGSFEKNQYEGCKFWSLWFEKFEGQDGVDIADLTGNKICFLDISPEGELFLVKMIVGMDSDTKEISFRCREVRADYYRYKGMSYRNLYGTEEYQKSVDRQRYVLDKEYFVRKEEFSLPDGYSMETVLYGDSDRYISKAGLQKCSLKKSDKTIYEYLCTYNHGARFKDFILHSNGRRYFPFHVDLYGISYLDIDSLEAYNYVPEGYNHDFSRLLGESFIVTDIHYDKKTDLIAYGGCYWAGPYNVMVGDFSDPLNFAPWLFDVGKIVDPESEGYEVDFKQWNESQLVVTVEGEEKCISIEKILKVVKHAGREV